MEEEEMTTENCDLNEEEENSTLVSLVVQKSLPLPSMCRARLNVEKPKTVSKLVKQIEKHSQVVNQLNTCLSAEVAVLSKIGYKYSCRYRPFYFWSKVRRLLQCCKRINVFNLTGLFSKLRNSFESFEPEERFTYLPSLRLVEYFLIRFIGSVSLFGATSNYSSKLFSTCKRYLATHAHNVPQHMLIISATSRLWILCSSIAKEMIAAYTTLFKLRKCLLSSKGDDRNRPSSVLPDGEKFPKDLYVWLKKHMDWCVHFEKPNISKNLWLKKELKKINDSKNVSLNLTKNWFTTHEDIGEPV